MDTHLMINIQTVIVTVMMLKIINNDNTYYFISIPRSCIVKFISQYYLLYPCTDKLLGNCNRNFGGQLSWPNRLIPIVLFTLRISLTNVYDSSYPPIPTFTQLSTSNFSIIRDHFYNTTFQFEIDHDDVTVKHITLSHLNPKCQMYINSRNRNNLMTGMSSIDILQVDTVLLYYINQKPQHYLLFI